MAPTAAPLCDSLDVKGFERPVRAIDLVGSDEFALRHPREHDHRLGTLADEGEGTGFDNLILDAYIERFFSVDEEAEGVHDWFASELSALGWRPRDGDSPNGVAMRWFRRGDESIELTVFDGPTWERLGWRRRPHGQQVWRMSYSVRHSP